MVESTQMKRLFSVVQRFSSRAATHLLSRFPQHDGSGFQTFSTRESFEGANRSLDGSADGSPVCSWLERIESLDGCFRSGLWESAAGRHVIKFDFDEWVHILEGEAHVTALGRTQILREDDVAFFRAGLDMTWMVPTYVRKVWVHRAKPQSLVESVVRKVVRLART